jgi:hypothetical protein
MVKVRWQRALKGQCESSERESSERMQHTRSGWLDRTRVLDVFGFFPFLPLFVFALQQDYSRQKAASGRD